MVKLRLRAAEVKWNAEAPHGILTIGINNLLTDYHSITDTEITSARTNRSDNRVIQNSRAMLNCVKLLISRDLLDTIFGQSANIPTFIWWTVNVLKKRNILINKFRDHMTKKTYKVLD